MRSQSRQAIDAIAENERRKLKAEMYNDAVGVTHDLVDAAIALSTRLRTMAMELRLAAHANTVGLGYPLPKARYSELLALYQAFSDGALRFIFLVENRRIVDPRILIFRTAMRAALHETHELMFSKFVLSVMPLLPATDANGEPFPYNAPSPESAEAAHLLSECLCEALMDVTSYSEDFLVELQNHLLGDLFANSVEHRKPLDPKCRVITLDKAQELEAWFSEHTAWGRQAAKIDAEARERFSIK